MKNKKILSAYLMDIRAVRSSRMGVKSEANAMCEFSIEAQPI